MNNIVKKPWSMVTIGWSMMFEKNDKHMSKQKPYLTLIGSNIPASRQQTEDSDRIGN